MSTQAHYKRPGRVEVNTFHRLVRFLVRHGVSLWGARVLSVRGRKSGELRSNPVNLLTLDGAEYLVAPRGHTEWVRNLRVAGEGELRVGKRVDRFTAVELPDADKVPVLRAYLKRWGWEVGMFFDGLDAKSPDEELLAAAAKFPVFRVALT
ncbi:nitroreductase family deazaflavin-dependent oxidoreductase [Actinokineospora auranticolor]|uniref:Deazaflavin-dependent oxidoreductase (Nitroreductase family) n=1 Tax=Actinokineospora auranticolor TaxID=155976 RepID=A0A2S6GHI1_9PSEU|nr:nitroreductase family deazaflavin-dependent oxidoreductase [Actinokineospora auranticolor]PPK64669.1 deazaflavin-dependent oxidoreductase (nitroreductase family) [Actinokineospora auranticolor]